MQYHFRQIHIISFAVAFFLCATPLAHASENIIINEIAWMGTTVSANDEWIELFNPTQEAVNLSGWVVRSEDGSPVISLSGSIPAKGYAVLERTNEESVPGVQALLVYSGALENNGEQFSVLDSDGNVVDEVDGSKGWQAGDAKTRQTMERILAKVGSDPTLNWQTSVQVGGSPGAQNSEPLPQQKIPSGGYAGYMVGIPLFPPHFAIALAFALACSLSILVLKRLIGRLTSNSSDALED